MVETLFSAGPVFLLILFGWALSLRVRVLDGFWDGAEWLTYHVFFPALLFRNALRVDLQAPATGGAVLASILVVVAMAVTVALVHEFVRPWQGSRAGALLQGAIRPNTYIALGLAQALMGHEGLALMSVCVAAVVPTVNVLCVVALTRWGSQGRVNWSAIPRGLIGNPLIIASLGGLLINALGLSVPETASDLLGILAAPALTLGLLTVGSALARPGERNHPGDLALAALLKLILLPAAGLGLAMMLHLDALATAVVVLYAAMPSSPSSYVLAVKLAAQPRLMAAIITTQTLVSFLTLPVLALLLL